MEANAERNQEAALVADRLQGGGYKEVEDLSISGLNADCNVFINKIYIHTYCDRSGVIS